MSERSGQRHFSVNDREPADLLTHQDADKGKGRGEEESKMEIRGQVNY